ncbi:MAG: hypothetical protein WC980_03135 [Candidatus Brocadiia bacterium]
MSKVIKLILTGQFPDVLIFFFGGIIISLGDVLFGNLTGRFLFYDNVASNGLIGAIIAAVIILVLAAAIYREAPYEESYNAIVLYFLKSQGIFLKESEIIKATNPLAPFQIPPQDRGFVISNKRLFVYEYDHIVWQASFDEVEKVEYLSDKKGFTVYLQNGTTYTCHISGTIKIILKEIRKLLQEKFYQR